MPNDTVTEIDGKRVPATLSTAVAMKGSRFQREIELDFIRGIAILMVVNYHSRWPLLGPLNHLPFPVGVIGVYLFFVLSGFLVGGLLMKEWKLRGRVDGMRFLVRRAFKLWPQYYVFLLASVAVGGLTFRGAWSNFVHLQNYFGGGLSHTWSLAVEEHVYLMLTAIFMLVVALRLSVKVVCGVMIALCAAVSATRYWYGFHGLRIGAGGQTHLCADGILLGVLVAAAYHFAPERFAAARAKRWIWFALMVLGFAGTQLLHPYEGWTGALSHDFMNLFSLSTLLLLYHRPHQAHKRNLVYRAIAWIGLYSYGIYLWHMNMLKPVSMVASRVHAAPSWVLGTLFAVLAVLVGVIATELIEFPMLRVRERVFPKRVDAAVNVSELETVPGPLHHAG